MRIAAALSRSEPKIPRALPRRVRHFLRQHEQSRLPERFGDLVLAPVEAAFGKRGDVAMAGEKVECFLLIAGEELGSDGGGDHDLGSTEFGLGVVSMAQGFEELIEEAVDGYHLFGHSRLCGSLV